MNSNYEKNPSIEVGNEKIWRNWDNILNEIVNSSKLKNKAKKVIVIETYTGVYNDELIKYLKQITHALFINASDIFKSDKEIEKFTYQDVTDNRIFGYMTRFQMSDFISLEKKNKIRSKIKEQESGVVIVYGTGASLIVENYDLLVYADLARWEIQLRMRKNEVHGLWKQDFKFDFTYQYKRAYFVDWRVCDKLKKELFFKMDYILDTNLKENPKMIEAKTMFLALQKTVEQPFRVKPYFDEGPWGGQWMKEVCGLDKNRANYAWCFDCVPEENSLLLNISGEIFEIPSINLVFLQTTKLLGAPVESRFGQEFPIRFDFLDTMEGGNLSFQVHPTTQYIKDEFGMNYTQDESYYILDAKDDATVYLGIKNEVNSQDMIDELQKACEGGKDFDADKFVNIFPAKKHDHFLIPNGTCHCSGINSMVLEISATPYIFTFKMWDWGRLGLDGKPRPININHAKNVINWETDTDYTKENLVNKFEQIAQGDGWMEEKTGLHKTEFIETRRHWFSKKVLHNTGNSVNVLNLIDGREAIVESPTNKFKPFVVHYVETFIIPANVGDYTIRPYGESENKKIATIKAYVRC